LGYFYYLLSFASFIQISFFDKHVTGLTIAKEWVNERYYNTLIGIRRRQSSYSMQRKDMPLFQLDVSLDIERIAWSLSSRLGGKR
jgi:hypothetical protein